MSRYDRALGRKPKTPPKLPPTPEDTVMGYVRKVWDIMEKAPGHDRYGTVEWAKKNEESAVAEAHHGLGQWLRNEWKMWEPESEIAMFFGELGIKHADDMSGIILTSFHRWMNGKPLELDAQVKYYQNYWKQVDSRVPNMIIDMAESLNNNLTE